MLHDGLAYGPIIPISDGVSGSFGEVAAKSVEDKEQIMDEKVEEKTDKWKLWYSSSTVEKDERLQKWNGHQVTRIK